MNNSNNKIQLVEAIESYTLLPKNSKQVLVTLVKFDEAVTAGSIGQALNLPKQVIYPCLSKLAAAGFINKLKIENTTYHIFSINKNRMEEILDLFNKTQNILKEKLNSNKY